MNKLLIGEHTQESLECDLKLERGSQMTAKDAIAYCESVQDYVSNGCRRTTIAVTRSFGMLRHYEMLAARQQIRLPISTRSGSFPDEPCQLLKKVSHSSAIATGVTVLTNRRLRVHGPVKWHRLPHGAARNVRRRADTAGTNNVLREKNMNTIRTILLGAALTAFATSAAFAQTAQTGAQGSAGLGANVQTPVLGVGAQAGAGATAADSGAGAGSLVGGAVNGVGKAVGGVDDAAGNVVGGATNTVGSAAEAANGTAKSAVHSAKQHAKHVAGAAKNHAEGVMSTAGDVGGGAKAKAGEALDGAAAAVQGGASVGVKGSASAKGSAM